MRGFQRPGCLGLANCSNRQQGANGAGKILCPHKNLQKSPDMDAILLTSFRREVVTAVSIDTLDDC